MELMSDEELISKCKEFLQSSSSKFKMSIDRSINDQLINGPDFWETDVATPWKRKSRPCETWNLFGMFQNAITSQYSSAPYHLQIESGNSNNLEENTKADIQTAINTFESKNETKSSVMQALSDCVISGYSALALSVVDKSESETELVLDYIDDPSKVAFDPSATTTSCIDAEEGAIVNYIPLSKAKRLYGDVVGAGYPDTVPPMCDIGDAWPRRHNEIQIVNYYYKGEDGKVVFAQLCGLQVIKHVAMPFSVIPIARLTGYKVRSRSGYDYIGIVSKTKSIQLGANIGYSTLLERLNRSPKTQFICHVDAVTDLEQYFANANSGELPLVLWKGSVPPTPIRESIETADLTSTITQSLTMMSQVLGIPVAGVNGLTQPDKTATEVLTQQVSSISNVDCFYRGVYNAIRHLGRCLIDALTMDSGAFVDFSVQSGPAVITEKAKQRQYLATLSNYAPEQMKPIILKYMADTLDDQFASSLSDQIVANMDPSIRLLADKNTKVDANAIHELNSMKAVLDNTMTELDKATQENLELKKQLDVLNMQVLNAKQQQVIDLQKHNDTVRLEEAKLMLEGAKIDNTKAAAESKAAIDTSKVVLDAEKSKMEIMSRYTK